MPSVRRGLDDIATCIGICPSCVRNRPEESRGRIEEIHAESREMFGLPTRPADSPDGIECKLCFHAVQTGKEPERVLRSKARFESSMRTDGRSRGLVSYLL